VEGEKCAEGVHFGEKKGGFDARRVEISSVKEIEDVFSFGSDGRVGREKRLYWWW
jgi:hypothetical protein